MFVESIATIKKKITRNTTVGDLLSDPEFASLTQEFLVKYNQDNPLISVSEGEEGYEMMVAMMKYMPLRALFAFNPENFDDEKLNKLLETFNTALVK